MHIVGDPKEWINMAEGTTDTYGLSVHMDEEDEVPYSLLFKCVHMKMSISKSLMVNESSVSGVHLRTADS